jgi:hypothetical protein
MPTTTSPVLPVGALEVADRVAVVALASAISSSASNTASSNERPLAVPRSASCATASAFSFSERARSSSTTRPCIRSLISRRRACCWSEVCFIAPSQARWKTANGFVVRIGRELLAQVVPHHAHRLGERGLELVLHRHRRLVAEVLGEHPRDVAGLGPNASSNLRSNTSAKARGALGEVALHLARPSSPAPP